MATAARHPAQADHFPHRARTPPHSDRKPPPIGRTEAKAGIGHAGNRRKIGAGGPGPGGLPTAASRPDTILGPVDAKIQGDGSTAFSAAINSIK